MASDFGAVCVGSLAAPMAPCVVMLIYSGYPNLHRAAEPPPAAAELVVRLCSLGARTWRGMAGRRASCAVRTAGTRPCSGQINQSINQSILSVNQKRHQSVVGEINACSYLEFCDGPYVELEESPFCSLDLQFCISFCCLAFSNNCPGHNVPRLRGYNDPRSLGAF